VLWLAGAALIYHWCNGIRFLCIDAGWGERAATLRGTARLVFVIGVVAVVLLGGMLL